MDDKNQLKLVGLALLWGATMFGLLLANHFLKINLAWTLLPLIILVICVIYLTRANRGEFEWAAIRWAGTWGSIAAAVAVYGLHFALTHAPVQMEMVKRFFVSSPNDAFESGLNTALTILIWCWGGANLVWWIRHR